jgi:hypothetical protein
VALARRAAELPASVSGGPRLLEAKPRDEMTPTGLAQTAKNAGNSDISENALHGALRLEGEPANLSPNLADAIAKAALLPLDGQDAIASAIFRLLKTLPAGIVTPRE